MNTYPVKFLMARLLTIRFLITRVIFLILMIIAGHTYATPTIDQQSMDIYNHDLQRVFTRVNTQLKKRLRDEIVAALDSVIHRKMGDFKLTQYHEPELSGFDAAPGVLVGNDQELTFKFPLNGGWRIRLPNVRVRFKKGVVQKTFEMDVTLSKLRFDTGLKMVVNQQGKLDITKVVKPTIDYDFDLSGDGFFQRGLYDFLEAIVKDKFIKDRLRKVVDDMYAKMLPLLDHPLEPAGKGLVLEETPPWFDMESIVKNIDKKSSRKIRDMVSSGRFSLMKPLILAGKKPFHQEVKAAPANMVVYVKSVIMLFGQEAI